MPLPRRDCSALIGGKGCHVNSCEWRLPVSVPRQAVCTVYSADDLDSTRPVGVSRRMRGLSEAAPALSALGSVRLPGEVVERESGLFTVKLPDHACVESGAFRSLSVERLQQLVGILPHQECLCGG